MSVESSVDLSQLMIPEPLAAYRIGENRFAVASYSEERPFMITCGLSFCKGIVIYNPEQQRGLMGHLSVVGELEKDLDRVVTEFGSDLAESYVHIVRADSQGDPPIWPTLDSLRDYFLKHNPRSLIVDRNIVGHSIRGIALRLDTGQVQEIDGSKGWTWSKQHHTAFDRRIYNVEWF